MKDEHLGEGGGGEAGQGGRGVEHGLVLGGDLASVRSGESSGV